MKIIIIGDGKIGSILAEALCRENHEVTLIDRHADILAQSNNDLDVVIVEGDGASHEIQREAGADSADLLIACTGADELNLLYPNVKCYRDPENNPVYIVTEPMK